MLKTYTDNYMNVLKNTYKSIVDLKGEQLHAKINTQYLDVKEVKSALGDEVAKYFNIKNRKRLSF